jgi:hypothetical protein
VAAVLGTAVDRPVLASAPHAPAKTAAAALAGWLAGWLAGELAGANPRERRRRILAVHDHVLVCGAYTTGPAPIGCLCPSPLAARRRH